MKHHYMLAIAISTLLAGQAIATESQTQSQQGTRDKLALTAAERGQIARTLTQRFAPEVTQVRSNNVAGWARKFGRLIGTADAANVRNAMRMPTLNTATAVLLGQSVDSSSIQAALKEAASGEVGPALLGSAEKDTVYTPLPFGRCRVADSRLINDPLFGYRTIRIEGQSDYTSQGGSGTEANGTGSANCGIPNDVTAYAISVTVLSNGQEGVFKLFRAESPTYKSGSTVYYTPVVSAANDIIVPSCLTCTSEVEIYSSSSTHYTLDVAGYFIKPEATPQDCVRIASTGFSIPPNTAEYHEIAGCPSGGYRPTTPYCYTYVPGVYSQGSGISGNTNSTEGKMFCAWNNTTASPQQVFQGGTCCRVPGR